MLASAARWAYPPDGPPRLLSHDLPAVVPPEVSAEAARALPLYERALEPAGPEVVVRALTRLHRRVVKAAEEQNDLTLRLAVYIEDLAGYPPDVVTEVCESWHRSDNPRGAWWPSVHELVVRMDAAVAERAATASALRRLADGTGAKPADDWRPPTDEECTRFSALMAELRQKLTVEEAARPARRAAVPVTRERTPEECAAARAAMRASAERLGIPLRSDDDAAVEPAPESEPAV